MHVAEVRAHEESLVRSCRRGVAVCVCVPWMQGPERELALKGSRACPPRLAGASFGLELVLVEVCERER
jgi:hypothetical protein